MIEGDPPVPEVLVRAAQFRERAQALKEENPVTPATGAEQPTGPGLPTESAELRPPVVVPVRPPRPAGGRPPWLVTDRPFTPNDKARARQSCHRLIKW